MAKSLTFGLLLLSVFQLEAFAMQDIRTQNRVWYRAENGLFRLTLLGPVAHKTFELLKGPLVETGQAPVGAIVEYRRGKQIQCFITPESTYSCDLTFNHNAEVQAPTAEYISHSISVSSSIDVGHQLHVTAIGTKPGHWISLTDATIAPKIYNEDLNGPAIHTFETGPHGHGTFVRQGRDFRCFKTYGLGIDVQFEFDENGIVSYSTRE